MNRLYAAAATLACLAASLTGSAQAAGPATTPAPTAYIDGVGADAANSTTTSAEKSTTAANGYLTWAADKVYVVDHTNTSWEVGKSIEAEDNGSPLDLVRVKECPAGATQCVDVTLGSLSGTVVGNTTYRFHRFSSGSDNGTLYQASVVLDKAWGKKVSAHMRRALVCHEVGHAVGLEHVNSKSTCMNPIIDGKVSDRPSATTYRLLAKMYASDRPVV